MYLLHKLLSSNLTTVLSHMHLEVVNHKCANPPLGNTSRANSNFPHLWSKEVALPGGKNEVSCESLLAQCFSTCYCCWTCIVTVNVNLCSILVIRPDQIVTEKPQKYLLHYNLKAQPSFRQQLL